MPCLRRCSFVNFRGLLKIICCSRDFTDVRITLCFLALWELRKCIGAALLHRWDVDGRFTPFRQTVTKASRFRAYHAGPEMVVGWQADRLNSWEASACLGLPIVDGFLFAFIAAQKRNFFLVQEKKAYDMKYDNDTSNALTPSKGWQCEYVSPESVLCITGAAATSSAATSSAGEPQRATMGDPCQWWRRKWQQIGVTFQLVQVQALYIHCMGEDVTKWLPVVF